MSHPLPHFSCLNDSPKTVKGWGHEIEIVNLDYCGKLLWFKKGAKLSFHHHRDKTESFLVQGHIIFRYMDTSDASVHEAIMKTGDIVHIPRLLPHQVEAIEESTITEFSSHHENSDSYRVGKGNSQT
jgi:uncharacterized RmlC-like cupin family protein